MDTRDVSLTVKKSSCVCRLMLSGSVALMRGVMDVPSDVCSSTYTVCGQMYGTSLTLVTVTVTVVFVACRLPPSPPMPSSVAVTTSVYLCVRRRGGSAGQCCTQHHRVGRNAARTRWLPRS